MSRTIYCIGLCILLNGLVASAVESDYTLINRLNTMFGLTFNAVVAEEKPIEEDVTFWCKTPANPNYVQVYYNDSSLNTKLDVTKPLAFCVHGWTDNYQRTWVRNLTSTYVATQDSNICAVDWSRLALQQYVTAANKTPEVGIYLGIFIQYLIDQNYFTVDNITLIGHSMGAHIAGFAGAVLDGQVPRLYGLDPAGPYFTKMPPQPTNLRLDKTDAKFVQAIHTDRYIIGANINLGHQDFYPNGGATPQPGCINPFTSYTYVTFSCSHFKAVLQFTESLHTLIIGKECNSYLAYESGFCNGNREDAMGPSSENTASGTIYTTVR